MINNHFVKLAHLLKEREKIWEEKNYHQSSFVPWRPTCVSSLYREWHDALDVIAKSYQQSLRSVVCFMPLFFLNYRKIRTPLTLWDNSNKNNVKKPKMPFNLRGKKKS